MSLKRCDICIPRNCNSCPFDDEKAIIDGDIALKALLNDDVIVTFLMGSKRHNSRKVICTAGGEKALICLYHDNDSLLMGWRDSNINRIGISKSGQYIIEKERDPDVFLRSLLRE